MKELRQLITHRHLLDDLDTGLLHPVNFDPAREEPTLGIGKCERRAPTYIARCLVSNSAGNVSDFNALSSGKMSLTWPCTDFDM